jgi:hypothetical protein
LIAIAVGTALIVVEDPGGYHDHKFTFLPLTSAIAKELTDERDISQNRPFTNDLEIGIGDHTGKN